MDTDPAEAVNWRMLWINENARMRNIPDIANNGTVRSDGQPFGQVILTGGIVTDRRFTYHNNSARRFDVRRDINPALLERFAPRVGWLEVYGD